MTFSRLFKKQNSLKLAFVLSWNNLPALICFSNATNSLSLHVAGFLEWWSLVISFVLHTCTFSLVLVWVLTPPLSGYWSVCDCTHLFFDASFPSCEVFLCICFIMSRLCFLSFCNSRNIPCHSIYYSLGSWPALCFMTTVPGFPSKHNKQSIQSSLQSHQPSALSHNSNAMVYDILFNGIPVF